MTSDITHRKIIAKGWTSVIYQHSDSNKVIKIPVGENATAFFDVERRIYERLSERNNRPSSILNFYGVDEGHQNGIVLEKAEKADLYAYFRYTLWPAGKAAPSLLLKWALQAAEALAFVHKCGIIHRDVHEANFSLDGELDLKLGDFGASSIDDGPGLMMYRTTHQLWVRDDGGQWRRDSGVAAEIFALGCVFYGMEAGRDVFGEEVEKEEIQKKLQERALPDLVGLEVLGGVIGKCWAGGHGSMDDVVHALRGITMMESVD